MSVTMDDVSSMYRCILGRRPESVDIVKKKAKEGKDFLDLRKEFLLSREFEKKYIGGILYMNFSNERIERIDVIEAFAYLLGRYPDHEQVIQNHLRSRVGRRDYYRQIVYGAEFRRKRRYMIDGIDVVKDCYFSD